MHVHLQVAVSGHLPSDSCKRAKAAHPSAVTTRSACSLSLQAPGMTAASSALHSRQSTTCTHRSLTWYSGHRGAPSQVRKHRCKWQHASSCTPDYLGGVMRPSLPVRPRGKERAASGTAVPACMSVTRCAHRRQRKSSMMSRVITWRPCAQGGAVRSPHLRSPRPRSSRSRQTSPRSASCAHACTLCECMQGKL